MAVQRPIARCRLPRLVWKLATSRSPTRRATPSCVTNQRFPAGIQLTFPVCSCRSFGRLQRFERQGEVVFRPPWFDTRVPGAVCCRAAAMISSGTGHDADPSNAAWREGSFTRSNGNPSEGMQSTDCEAADALVVADLRVRCLRAGFPPATVRSSHCTPFKRSPAPGGSPRLSPGDAAAGPR